MKTFAIGDVHGCLSELRRLMDIMSPARDDLLIFMGDFVDRGPDSKGVVDYVLDLPQPRICLRGNHEEALLEFLQSGQYWLYQVFGIDSTLRSYGLDPGQVPETDLAARLRLRLPPRHLEFFQSLRLWYEDGEYMFVHAGLDPLTPELREPRTLLWIRDLFVYSKVNFGKRIVFGHNPFYGGRPYFDNYKIGLDTGCWRTGVLTGMELPGEKIYQTAPRRPAQSAKYLGVRTG